MEIRLTFVVIYSCLLPLHHPLILAITPFNLPRGQGGRLRILGRELSSVHSILKFIGLLICRLASILCLSVLRSGSGPIKTGKVAIHLFQLLWLCTKQRYTYIYYKIRPHINYSSERGADLMFILLFYTIF